MGIFFGKSKKNPQTPKKKNEITAKDKAVYDLKVQRDRLQKYQTRHDALIEKEKQAARVLLQKGQKQRALLILKKKKYHENMIAKTYGKLANIEELVNSIRFAQLQADVFAALSEGNIALQEINSQMSIEDVEKMMEDTEEAVAYQNEISELLSTELSTQDDDAVLKELEMIEQEQALELDLPEVPTGSRPVAVESTQSEEKQEQEQTQQKPTVLLG